MALLISVVGGFVLAAAAAGRRTEAAFPGFVAAHGFDAAVYASQPVRLDQLPGVASVIAEAGPYNGQPECDDCTRPIDPTNLTVLTGTSQTLRLVKLISGRWPDPSDPHQALASFTLQQDAGVRIGTVIHVPFYAPSQLSAVADATGAPPKPTGPTVSLRVVGIEASESEFPSGSTASYSLYATPAFARSVLPRIASGYLYLVTLRHGSADLPRFTARANALGVQGVQSQGELVSTVEQSIHPQTVGWWLLAALSAVVGLAVIGQALARQTIVEGGEYPTLTALGAERRQLVMVSMARNVAVGLAGAVGAVVLAAVLSPLTPVGEARIAETSGGIALDPWVLPIGAVGIVVVVFALGIWPAVRASRMGRPDDQPVVSSPSATVARLSSVGAPPSMVIGVRNALQRRSGATTVPVGSALLGTVLAVIALCGTAVFGASLSHLTATPSLYGDAFQLNFSVYPGQSDPGLLASLEHRPGVTGITRGLATEVSVNGSAVGTVAATALRGPLLFSTVSGKLPTGDGQIALGGATMRQVGAHVGSTVSVTVSTPSGGKRTVPFRVVSQVSLPGLGGLVSLANGALFTIHGYEAAVCPPGAGQEACRQSVEGTGEGGILAGVVSGPAGQQVIDHYLDSYRSVITLPVTPTSLVNFGEAVNFPLIFGGILAVFGAATLAHLLVVSVSRRRREIGLLKVLGFVNRQVVTAVGWQASTIALVGVVFGIPLGVVIGRATWKLFATQLGVVPVSVVPVWFVAALAAGVLVVANLLAIGPALAATRSKPGLLLRAP
jgi:ABC-type lipoprotein release transport system permease subunit